MNLGVFLAIGESIEDFKLKGQESLVINNNFKEYSKNFFKIYIYSYANESYVFFNNVYIIPNKYNIHRFFYVFLIPIIHYKTVGQCKIIRCYQITAGLTGLTAKLFLNKIYVVNYGYNYPEYAAIEGKKLLALILRVTEVFVLRFATVVIATSTLLRKKVLNFNNRTVFIPNGIDVNVFRPKRTKKTIDLLYVGRFEIQKNLDFIIKALSLLNKHKLRLVFIGSGSLKKRLVNLATVYNVNLTLIDQVSNNLLAKYYNQSKIFVLASKIEGNPKSLLEAMSCSCAVIGNNVSGISSIINNTNGYLFDNTIKSLSEKIEKLITSTKLRNKLGNKARFYIKNNYDFSNTFKKEISLLKNQV